MSSNSELAQPLNDEENMKIAKMRSTFGGQEVTEKIAEEGSSSGFGAKKIGWLGSWTLLFNNITGPGMISLISIYITCGWLPATLLFLLVGVISGFVSVWLIDAMQMVPGNSNFEKRVELMYLAKRYLGKGLYWASMVFFLLNLQLNNIGSIIVSTQQMDWTIMAFGVPSYALELYPAPGFVHTKNQSLNLDDSPFGDAYVISLGFLIVLAATVPLGYLNLDDNIWVQIICGIILGGVVFTAWFYEFGKEGLDLDSLPAMGQNVGAQIGNIFFNYAYVVTVPSWINEKKDSVDGKAAIWSSLIPSVACFVLIGSIGAMSDIVGNLTRESPNQGLDLTVALGGAEISSFARISTFIFPWVALVNGVPVMSIIIRYNLLENKICNKMWANLFAVVLPWILTIIFYAGNWVQVFLDYGSSLTTIPLNLMLPCYLYIVIALKEGLGEQTKTKRLFNWIFIIFCGVGNVLALVFQVINDVEAGQNNTSPGGGITTAAPALLRYVTGNDEW